MYVRCTSGGRFRHHRHGRSVRRVVFITLLQLVFVPSQALLLGHIRWYHKTNKILAVAGALLTVLILIDIVHTQLLAK